MITSIKSWIVALRLVKELYSVGHRYLKRSCFYFGVFGSYCWSRTRLYNELCTVIELEQTFGVTHWKANMTSRRHLMICASCSAQMLWTDNEYAVKRAKKVVKRENISSDGIISEAGLREERSSLEGTVCKDIVHFVELNFWPRNYYQMQQYCTYKNMRLRY